MYDARYGDAETEGKAGPQPSPPGPIFTQLGRVPGPPLSCRWRVPATVRADPRGLGGARGPAPAPRRMPARAG